MKKEDEIRLEVMIKDTDSYRGLREKSSLIKNWSGWLGQSLHKTKED